jgi:ABC-2 type transport system permease protein
MDSQRSRSLVPWAFRSHRMGVLSIGLGFGGVVAIMAPAYVAAARAFSGGLAAMAAEAQPVAASFQFLTGPVDRLDTVGGYLSYKVFPDIALLVAVYAALQASQVTRGAETKGLFDMWFAAGRTRSAIMRDCIVSFILSLGSILICLFVGTVAGGALSGVQLVLPALGQCIAVGMVGVVAFALGLLAAQFCQAARTSSAIVGAFLVAGFFVANMSDHLGAFTFLRYLSPFYYYVNTRTLVAGVSFDLASMGVLVGASLVAVTAAWRLSLRRDTGGVILARAHRTRHADYTFHPSAVWRRSLWTNWIAEQPLALASWFAGIVVFTTIEAAVVPSAMKIIDTNGGGLKTFLQNNGIALTTERYLAFFLSFTALLVAAFTVTQVARWASDAVQHRNDAVLTQPVSMWRLLVERAISLLVMSAVVGLAVVLGIWLGATLGNYSMQPSGLARSFIDIVLLCLAIGGVGTLAVAVLRSSLATAVTGAVLVASFFLTTVAGLLSWPGWTTRPSVFDAFGSPYLAMPGIGSLTYLVALGVVGVLAAYIAMRRGARIVT